MRGPDLLQDGGHQPLPRRLAFYPFTIRWAGLAALLQELGQFSRLLLRIRYQILVRYEEPVRSIVGVFHSYLPNGLRATRARKTIRSAPIGTRKTAQSAFTLSYNYV